MSSSLRAMLIHVIRDNSEQGFTLVITNPLSIQGRVIEQTSSSSTHIIFKALNKATIVQKNVLMKLQIKCVEDANRYLMLEQDYNQLIKSINQGEQREDSLRDGNQDNSEEDEENQRNYSNTKKEEDYQNNYINRYQEESDNNGDNEHRGRGRPKGSKNKKTIIKESMVQTDPPATELRFLLTGIIKRGKGRPKGSKNKAKDYSKEMIKIQEKQSNMVFGKRGKGRPKGSKNKIKAYNQSIMIDEQHESNERKKRGRPPGAKNRANSVSSSQSQKESEDVFQKFELQRPHGTLIEGTRCCKRCESVRLKCKILNAEVNLEETKGLLVNVSEDIGLENRGNLIEIALRLGDWESFQLLLEVVSKVTYCFKSPWNVQKAVEKTNFEVKTKKEYLSKTGKEANYVLLHDGCRTKQVWWRQVGLERIIQCIPNESPSTERILAVIQDRSPDLAAQLYANLASILRTGNSLLSYLILKQILLTPNHNPFDYSQQHYQVLIGNFSMLNKFKKFNLVKHNNGKNYCSPIHAAAICEDSGFLMKILEIFTDVINVEDSQHRRPIHYAAIAANTINLEILVESGAELKQYDRKRMTPLMLACYHGILPNVEYILEKVRDTNYLNFKSDEGYTALHYSILKNHSEVVERLMADPLIDCWVFTKERGDIFHLLAGTGNIEILNMLFKKELMPMRSYDKFKRTPAMIALRNNNNDCFIKMMENGCKFEKIDSSSNTLLHYAAAYGNVEGIIILRDRFQQMKNKKGIYPWEIAVYKGHLGAAYLLDHNFDSFDFVEDPLYNLLTNIRGTPQFLEIVKYVANLLEDLHYVEKNTGNTYLHLIASLSEEQYVKNRTEETFLSEEEATEEFIWIQDELLEYFIQEELDEQQENTNGQTPLRMCIENNNLVGFRKLLKGKLEFTNEPAVGNGVLHCLCNLANRGYDEMHFVEEKLKLSTQTELKTQLKKIDHNGFDFLLYFVKKFAQNALKNFRRNVKSFMKKGKSQQAAEKKSFQMFSKFEDKFITLVEFLTSLGCDINSQVSEKKGDNTEGYKKWGIQHFIMRFPSLKLVKFFKGKIRDFNIQNNQGMTPMHLFCKNVKSGNLLETKINISDDYQAESVLLFLLQKGLNPNCYDSQKALPILYAALNGQIKFMLLLRQYNSEINFCTTKNEVPLIEVIKKHQNYSIEEIERLMKLGCDPNFPDMDKRNALHHLVFCSFNFDSSPEICKLLLDYSSKINALDKYERSPAFYCFTKMSQDNSDQPNPEKVQILQALMSHKDINLDLIDLYRRSLVHYACENNYFFSILYLLDRNINLEATDYQENTPLAICLTHQNLDQAALIISKGVKYGFVNHQGNKFTYFSYAIIKSWVGICFMLLDNGYPIKVAIEETTSESFKDTLIQKYG